MFGVRTKGITADLNQEEICEMKKAIVMTASDNVATALESIGAGDDVEILSTKNDVVSRIKTKESIPFGCKVALSNIEKDANIFKYGTDIGKCTFEIKKGELVHVHNLISLRISLPESVKKEVLSEMNFKKA
jgi:altronate dehydratase small subunit